MTDCIDLTEEDVDADLDTQFETDVIEAVKQQPCLFMKAHPRYKSKMHNEIAWLKVSKILNKPTITCMNKWYFLLQTFLYFSRLETNNHTNENALKWPHYKVFKELQPHMIDKYVELLIVNSYGYNITNLQLRNLLKIMEQNSKKLMSVFISIEERQEIWANMAASLNADEGDAPLPIIRWQKVWWNLKQGLRRKIEKKDLSAMAALRFQPIEVSILTICGVTLSNKEQIINSLVSYIEFDVDTDHLICKQCITLQNGNNSKKLCEKCLQASIVSCDVCSRAPFSNACDISHWSAAAKELIPLALRNESKLSVCQICYTTLKRRASLTWKVCRVCAKETNYNNLENILVSSFQDMRDEFRCATKFTFSITDGLPCYICLRCKERLVEFNFFYKSFISAQTLLQDIHKKNFIGEVLKLKNASLQKPSKNVWNKRPGSFPKPSFVTEEFAPSPNKRKRLTTVSTVSKDERQGNTSVIVNNFEGVPQNPNPKDSSSVEINERTTDRSAKPQIILQPSVHYTNCLTTLGTSQVKTSVFWTTCVPISGNSALDTSASTNAAPGSKMGNISNVGPVIDIKRLLNSDQSKITETRGDKPNSSTVPQISIGNDSNVNLPPVASSPTITIKKMSKKNSDGNSFNQSSVAMPHREKPRIVITKVPILNKPNPAAPTTTVPNTSLSSQIFTVSSNENRTSNLNQISLSLDSQVDRGTLNIRSLSLQNTSHIIAKPKEQQLSPSSIIQQTLTHSPSIRSSTPLRQSVLNPLLQNFLNRPALKVTVSPVAGFHSLQITKSATPAAHISSVQLPKPSSSQIEMSQSSTQKYVEIKKSTKANQSTKQPLKDSTTKETARKPPARRMTIHHLSSTKFTDRPRRTSLDGEVIEIRDDTPPREVQPPENEDIQVDHISSLQLPKHSSSQIELSQPSTQKYVDIKKSTKANQSTKQPLNDSTTKETARKPPARRMTIHHLSSTKFTDRPRRTSLDGEVIEIRDDTPPREVQPPENEDIQVDLGSAVSNLNPLMFYPDSVDLDKTLLKTDITLNKALKASQETEAHLLNGDQLNIISPSLLIDVPTSKPFRRVTPTQQMCGKQLLDATTNRQPSKQKTIAVNNNNNSQTSSEQVNSLPKPKARPKKTMPLMWTKVADTTQPRRIGLRIRKSTN